MLATSFCYEVNYHTTLLPMTSQVPRCLFGKPNPRDTIEMLQEALDAERSRFAKRWGVNPLSEDKENNYQRRNKERIELSPNKKRSNPYSRQTNIHGEQHFFSFSQNINVGPDAYWRARDGNYRRANVGRMRKYAWEYACMNHATHPDSKSP